MRLLYLVTALLLVAAAGCVIAATAHDDTLRSRGSHDLNCLADQLTITNIGGTSYEVAGCGAAQVYTCNRDGTTCVAEGNALPPPR